MYLFLYLVYFSTVVTIANQRARTLILSYRKQHGQCAVWPKNMFPSHLATVNRNMILKHYSFLHNFILSQLLFTMRSTLSQLPVSPVILWPWVGIKLIWKWIDFWMILMENVFFLKVFAHCICFIILLVFRPLL